VARRQEGFISSPAQTEADYSYMMSCKLACSNEWDDTAETMQQVEAFPQRVTKEKQKNKIAKLLSLLLKASGSHFDLLYFSHNNF
jgi:hypothetical protein